MRSMNVFFHFTFLKWLTALLIIFSGSQVFAQILSARAELDSNEIMIGEQVRLKLIVDYRNEKQDFTIKWPTISDTLSKNIEVVEKSDIDSVMPNQESDPYTFTLTQTLTITSFDSGFFAIPPIQFLNSKDPSNTKETEALLLTVNTVTVDTVQPIKDIKLPLDAPLNFRELLPSLIGGAAILAIIVFLVWYIKKRLRKKPVIIPEKPALPAHVIALEQLAALKGQNLWQQGKLKEYYSGISDITRIYIERRFHIPAMEQTTDEIMKSIRATGIDEDLRRKLKQLLLLADLVKFAKEHPLPFENETAMKQAEDFVRSSAPVIKEQVEEVKTNTEVQ